MALTQQLRLFFDMSSPRDSDDTDIDESMHKLAEEMVKSGRCKRIRRSASANADDVMEETILDEEMQADAERMVADGEAVKLRAAVDSISSSQRSTWPAVDEAHSMGEDEANSLPGGQHNAAHKGIMNIDLGMAPPSYHNFNGTITDILTRTLLRKPRRSTRRFGADAQRHRLRGVQR
jgi:hypothetical protein